MSRLTKIFAIALVVSAALNVFFVGFWAAQSARRWHGQRDNSGPDLHQRDLGPVWKQHEAALAGSRQAIAAARRAARDALVAEPFQPEALEGALANLRKQSGEAQLEFHRSLVVRIEGMGPEERRKLAESRLFMGLERTGPPPVR
jgi:uncharacterized membrane protein